MNSSTLPDYVCHKVLFFQIESFFPGNKSNKSILLYSVIHHHTEYIRRNPTKLSSILAWAVAITLKLLLTAWDLWAYRIGPPVVANETTVKEAPIITDALQN